MRWGAWWRVGARSWEEEKMGRLSAQGAAITFFAWWRGISHEAGAGKPGREATPQINGQTSITIAQSISTLSTGKSEPAIFLSFALRVR